ncbi:TPA: hypothetical protein ACNINW_001497 [Proteus mirabilis]
MTVSTELSHEEYIGNGVTTDFDFRFRIFEGKHLIVVVADSDGNEKTLKNGTDYTIVGAGSYHGGKVVLNKPLAQGWKILLERDLPVVQETDLRNQGKFFAEVHEDAFDYLTMLIQKALGTFSLSLRKPTYLSNYYDAKGNRIANLAPPKADTDATNKEYVDNSIKYIDSKTLRAKDKPINVLPNTEQRANKILAFDDNGQPITILPESGSASDVLIELAKIDGYKRIGGLESRLSILDISLIDGNKNSDFLNSIFEEFKGKNVTLYSSLSIEFNIDKETTLYGDFDLSNCIFNLNGGRVNYNDERNDYVKKIELTGYPLKELSKKITSLESFIGWENSLVKITSNEVDLYRYLNGEYTPKYKGETNFHSKNGDLLYSLKNEYNNPVDCYLIKLPARRNKIKLPQFIGVVNRWAFNIQRSLVDVYSRYDNTLTSVPDNHSILSSGDTYGVNWFVNMAGIEQSNNNSRYSILMEYVLKHKFIDSTCGKGWRAIDGNYCRDISIEGCNFDSVSFHYGSSKIRIENSIIPNSSFGTGAHDESVDILNSTIQRTGVRSDYGELKGDFNIIGGKVIAPELSGVHGLFTCYPGNVTKDKKQPRILHLPKKIRISTNICWSNETTLNLVEFRNNFYNDGSYDYFYMPEVFDISGCILDGVNATFELTTDTGINENNFINLVLTPLSSEKTKLSIKIGRNIGVYNYNIRSSINMEFGSNIIYGSKDCSFTAEKCSVGGMILSSSGNSTYLGYMSLSKLEYIIPESGNHNLSCDGFTFFNEVTFNGTKYMNKNGNKPIINVWANSSKGNIAINAKSTDSRDVLDKKTLICPREGEAGNF